MLGVTALAAALAALSSGLFAALLLDAFARGTPQDRISPFHREAAAAVRTLVEEGRIDTAFGGRRALGSAVAAGGVVGWSALGPVGGAIGAASAPLLLRTFMRARRRRHAARFDAGAADLALALASALAAGRSVRGALLTAGGSTPAPLGTELERVAVDLTLGRGLGAALSDLRVRTGSERIGSLVAAIELHRGSGGDLVRLTRELADAFRDRDRATRDALAATAQARYTAIVVAAIPFVVLAALELASPGMVTGALSYLPTAAMLVGSVGLMSLGVLLARRTGR